MKLHPKNLLIKDFTYELPDNRIAKFPLPERDESKLLIYKNKLIAEDIYYNLHEHLPQNSLLVFNNTKVVAARLLFKKSTGSIIEIFCLEPADIYADITTAMLQKEKVLWKCLIGGAKKWKEEDLGKVLPTGTKSVKLTAKKISAFSDYFLVEFNWDDVTLSFAEILQLAGSIPLPPYLNRETEESDKERYQTIYAKHEGSVAAPTAGLHFTERLLKKLEAKNITHDFVTLHVGAGTFKPVKAEVIAAHEMHAEFIDVRAALIENLLKNIEGDIVAVGTTSLRTVESLYWLGVKTILQPAITEENLQVYQWEPYEIKTAATAEKALQALLKWMQEHKLTRLLTKTQIIIAPGYTLKIAKALVTNFHQPKSTLLLLVAALIGDDWKKVYNYALENEFRFLSYGDGCLLYAKPQS